MKQTSDLKAVHDQAMKRADSAWTFERENVREGREDQRFYAGDQWDDAAKKARGVERPMLTVPRLGTFVRQVTGDIRQNTPAIKVLPARGKASQDKADILNGMIRSIEAESDADACYEKAASNVAQAGQGAFRIVTEYCNEKTFDQDIRIRPIADPFGVLIDPLAQLPDKSDMGYGFIYENISKEQFKADYPDFTADDIPLATGDGGTGFQWRKDETVRIAEYWCKEKTTRKLYLVAGTATDKLPPGAKAERERAVEVVSIVSYMMSGKEILSGPHEWAGKYIPICFVPGEEVTIDGATKRKGIVRDAKDSQRLLNYAVTTQAESTALQPKAPYILTKAQIKGYEKDWNSAGTKAHPYLVYNHEAANPNAPQRSQPPVMSSGLSELTNLANQAMHDVTGIYPAALGAKSNETSGIAIRARQNEADTGSNYVAGNLKRAIAYAGRILVDLIPRIYDGERIVRILKEDGSHEMRPINQDYVDEKTGEPMPRVDLAEDVDADVRYDVVVSTGPGYLTKQQEMVDTMLELGRTIPQVGQVAPDLLVKALGFPQGDEIAKRLEKTLPPGLVGDEPMQPPPPNPRDAADALDKAASADLKRAQTSKTLLEADQLAASLSSMGVQLQALTQLVQGLAQSQPQGQSDGQPPMQPPPEMPPGGAPPMPNGQMAADGMPPMEELEPMGAPV